MKSVEFKCFRKSLLTAFFLFFFLFLEKYLLQNGDPQHALSFFCKGTPAGLEKSEAFLQVATL